MLTRDRRSAFTLIELLVVISIIAVLAALTATAVFGVRRNMQKTSAETTLQKIDQKLLQKVKTIRDQIQEDLTKRSGAENPEVYSVLTACGGDKERAKGVLLYARLRRDLPMTFAEARGNFVVCGHTYRASPAFASLPAAGTGDIEESAACLYTAVAAMGSLDGLEQQVGTSQAGHKVFIDGIGQPVGFNRLGYDGNGGELNKAPAFDPFYPNKSGAGAYRNLATEYDATNGANAFNNQVWLAVRQPAVSWLPAPTAYPGLKHHTAFCFSAGLNRTFAEPPSNGIYDGDNLFSYRLRLEGGSGD
jgi:prepilin-type N-terminal cleavage/methylation domain-containing protein